MAMIQIKELIIVINVLQRSKTRNRKAMRLLEYINVSMYRIKEFFLYTICGIEFYRNYERFYWRNIFNKK
jgi:hypothetical protein